MTQWIKATLGSGHAIYFSACAAKRVRGQGKEFTAVYFGGNYEPLEIPKPGRLVRHQPERRAI